jgi:ribosomal protein L25 (general stress protein Ctc)
MKRSSLVNSAYAVLRKHGYPKADAYESAEEVVAYVIHNRTLAQSYFHADGARALVEKAAEAEWGIEFNDHRRYPTKDTEL